MKIVSNATSPDIRFAAPLSWANTSRLTLDSYRSILFQQPVTVAGTGALTITTNDGGSDGDFWFEKKGRIDFWDLHSSLIINRKSYYLVGNIAELAQAVSAQKDGRYALAEDYDAAADGTYSSAPVAIVFRGTFDGLGHTVLNLKLHDEALYAKDGLISETSGSAVVRNIALAKAEIRGGYYGWLGGLVGKNLGTMSRVAVTGAISSFNIADVMGGITGENDGVIENSHFSGGVHGKRWLGGIAGENHYGAKIVRSTAGGSVSQGYVPGGGVFAGGLAGGNSGYIADSHSTSTVNSMSTQSVVGGLVGGSNGTITRSYSTGAVSKKLNLGELGGFIGFNDGTVTQSFATGSVTNKDQKIGDGGTATGGFIGRNDAGGRVLNCYALGAVFGRSGEIGGFVGDGDGLYGGTTILDSYSTGSVTGGDGYNSRLGGFAGLKSEMTDHGYWDLDTSGITDPNKGCGSTQKRYCAGIRGITDQRLRSGLPNGFDPNVWGQKSSINDGYPYLLADPPPK